MNNNKPMPINRAVTGKPTTIPQIAAWLPLTADLQVSKRCAKSWSVPPCVRIDVVSIKN
ncbi:MAG: hypothetical protein GY710_04690 [Desulfobacteraceae bacterium]|nr:hypothetical protein [Desulfobacteraceae bacterium]